MTQIPGVPDAAESLDGKKYEVSAQEIKHLITLGVVLGKRIYQPELKIQSYFLNKNGLLEPTVNPVDLASQIHFGKDVKPDELLAMLRVKPTKAKPSQNLSGGIKSRFEELVPQNPDTKKSGYKGSLR